MTVINPSSISGITSITMPSGDGNVLTVHTNDGTERFRIDSSGNVKVGSACTISQDGDVFFTGVCTATTLAGSGANLTALPAANLTGALPAISGANLTGIAATDNVRTGILDVAGVSTFRNTMNVGAAVTISESGIEASGIGITVANINGAQIGGRRNLIINGAMQVAQRSTSAVTIAGGRTWTDVDRFGQWTKTAEGSWKSGQQVSDAPTGFQYSRKITSLAANTVASDSYHTVRYSVEGYDAKQLNCGFSSAKTVTLSFYVKSSLTGTFGLNFTNSANNRSYATTYTISAADTWEQKTITLTLDTTGTWPTTNDVGLEINWQLAMGSSYQTSTLNQWQANWRFPDTGANTLMTTNGATFQLTGVQLEVGSQATAFEHRSYGEELAICQRYYFKFLEGNNREIGVGWYYSGSHVSFMLRYPTTMRAIPTGTVTDVTNSMTIYRVGAADQFNTFTFENGSTEQYSAYNSNGVSGTAGQAGIVRSTSSAAKVEFSAEL